MEINMQNHQNDEPLPVLNPQIEGYKPVELYQWKICVQFYSRGALTKYAMADVGDKIKSLVIKLQEFMKKTKFCCSQRKEQGSSLKLSPKKQLRCQRKGVLKMFY
eukprot:8212550-Ditylum_brightwellii.AAC.1